MDRLTVDNGGGSKNIVAENIEMLKRIFPDVFTEGSDGGDAIDFDALKAVLGEYVDPGEERYSFTWHGKSAARRIAQTPSTGTLRPCRDESVDWDTTQNLFIEGDNLEVLKLLQKSYHGKVKMIYIDPPYNTGNEFIYPDKYQDNLQTYLEYTGQIDSEGRKFSSNSETGGRYHTNWLNMMYPRLRLARNLLRDDGVILISIDDNEVANLRKVCDEVFGEENFVDPIVWKKRYGGGAKEKFLVALHEYALVYAKSKSSLSKMYIPLEEESIKRYYKKRDEHFDRRGPYRTHPLEAMQSFDARENLRFPIPAPNGDQVWPKRQWRWGQDRVNVALERSEIEFSQDRKGDWVLSSKQYLKDESGEIRRTKPFTIIDDVFTQHGTNEFISIFGNAKIFDFPKPSLLMYKLISIALNNSKDDIVLDFFCGSAATAHAVMRMNADDGGNRSFIMIQLPEECDEASDAYKAGFGTIAEIGKERIRRVSQRIKEEQPDYNGDLGFRVLKLSSSNVKPWDADFDTLEQSLFDSVNNIKEDRNEEDVLYEILLKYGLNLTVPIEERDIAGAKVFIVGLGALVVCLATDVTLDVVEGIATLKAELQPEVMRVVFRDSGFKDDVVKTNAVQILRQHDIIDVKSL